MIREQRPGGLTALAVVNFIMGALSLIGALVRARFLWSASGPAAGEGTAGAALQSLGAGPFVAILALELATGALFVASAFGYLGLRAFLGRTLGNVCVPMSIASSLLLGLVLAPALDGGFGLGTVLHLVYPILLLLLINTVFREDFVY